MTSNPSFGLTVRTSTELYTASQPIMCRKTTVWVALREPISKPTFSLDQFESFYSVRSPSFTPNSTPDRKMSSLRRNGLLSSCEPCRRSKLKCDHTIPCGRCRRRKRPTQCIYHPAPMTKLLSSEDQDSATIFKKSSLIGTRNTADTSPSHSCSSNSTSQGNGTCKHICSEGPLRDRFIADWSKKAASSPGTGVLGPTSYSAVYDDSEDVIRSPAVTTSFRDLSKSLRRSRTSVDDADIQVGAELLLFLHEDFTLYERMSISKFSHCEGYVFAPPWLRLLFASVRQMLNNAIRDESDPLPDLVELSKNIHENCSKTIYVDAHMTPQDYFISMPNRWEVIGVIFSIIGASSFLLPASDMITLHPNAANVDRQGLSLVCISAGEKCIKFCDNAGVMSEPLSWALLAHASLLTYIYGDHGKKALFIFASVFCRIMVLCILQVALKR